MNRPAANVIPLPTKWDKLTESRHANVQRTVGASMSLMSAIGGRDEEFARLAFVEAASFVLETDLSDELDALRHDLRIDADGYPLDTNGDPIPGASRQYVPQVAL